MDSSRKFYRDVGAHISAVGVAITSARSGDQLRIKALIAVLVLPFFKDCMMGHQPNGIDLDETFRVLLVEPAFNFHA